jgi:hypothetical protein
MVHLEAGRGQRLYGCFCGRMVSENSNDCVGFFHVVLLGTEVWPLVASQQQAAHSATEAVQFRRGRSLI